LGEQCGRIAPPGGNYCSFHAKNRAGLGAVKKAMKKAPAKKAAKKARK